MLKHLHILNESVTLVEKKSDYKTLRKKESSSKRGKTIEKSDDPIRIVSEDEGVELYQERVSYDSKKNELEKMLY